MAIKTYQLMALEEFGVFYQNSKGEWCIGMHGDTDVTEYLYKSGMFEH